jgi:hypothetical protein
LAREFPSLLGWYTYFVRQMKREVCAYHPKNITETTIRYRKKFSGASVYNISSRDTKYALQVGGKIWHI